jgi:hypothetical protein
MQYMQYNNMQYMQYNYMQYNYMQYMQYSCALSLTSSRWFCIGVPDSSTRLRHGRLSSALQRTNTRHTHLIIIIIIIIIMLPNQAIASTPSAQRI